MAEGSMAALHGADETNVSWKQRRRNGGVTNSPAFNLDAYDGLTEYILTSRLAVLYLPDTLPRPPPPTVATFC